MVSPLKKQAPAFAIQSVRRAVALLRCFSESEPELGVMALSARLGLHKSTVSRMLATLQYEGLVSQNPTTGKYRLGLGLISLAGVALGRLDLRGAAQPYLDGLVATTRETVNVTVLDEDCCVNIERASSPQPIRYVGWIGRRMPLHCTASGKVLLAAMPAGQRAALLPSPLPRYTGWTIVELAALERSLEEVCRQGYAIVHEEFEEGFSAVAAPVFDRTGSVAGTLSVSGPSFRLPPERMATFVQPLLDTARLVSAELGYGGKP